MATWLTYLKSKLLLPEDEKPEEDNLEEDLTQRLIHYAAIKSALIHLTGYYAKYYKGKNIRFNTISPGGIANDHEANFSNQYKEYTLNKGLLDSEDILGSVEYLISDKSKYVNGQNIIIDDGFTL